MSITKICIIRSNPIRPDSRVEKVAWSLAKAGFDVHILSWDRDSNHEEQDGQIVVAGVSIPITWLGYKASFGEGFKNIKAYLKFQLHMGRWLQKNKNNFDAVHACDFDTAFFSLGIVKRQRKKFIFDIFDFICGDPHSLLQRYVKKAQFEIISKADATIICTEERERQIAGSHPKRVVVIHNTPIAELVNEQAAVKTRGKVKVVYVGILQDYRLLKEIAEYFTKHNEFEFHIGGFGKYNDYFLKLSQQCSNIKFYGRLPYENTLELEKKCDIMLAIYDPAIENHKYAAPNKFYESLMLGKPVMMVKGTGMSQVVEENDIGVVIDYSVMAFERGLNELLRRNGEWPAMEHRMKRLYKERYNWKKMEERLIQLYHSI